MYAFIKLAQLTLFESKSSFELLLLSTQNEVSWAYKRIIDWQPFINRVYWLEVDS